MQDADARASEPVCLCKCSYAHQYYSYYVRTLLGTDMDPYPTTRWYHGVVLVMDARARPRTDNTG